MPVAVVTGASRGLGAAFARGLAGRGYDLVLAARDERALADLAEFLGPRALPVALDVTDEASVAGCERVALERFGRIDLLVNNAGVGLFKRLEEFNRAEIEHLFAVNVVGAWSMTRAFLPALKAARGTVVMVSSDVSTRTFPRGGPYCATKFALRALTRTLQQENPELRVLELRPGATDTHFAGSSPGAPGKETLLRPETVSDALLAVLYLPQEARSEELVVRSVDQAPEY